MRGEIRNVVKISVLVFVILCTITISHLPIQGDVRIIMKGDILPRVYPEECKRFKWDENTQWTTCLRKNQYITDIIEETGIWEKDHIRIITEALKLYPKAAYLDIGCNVGPHVCLAATLTNRVFAVDPSKHNLAYIRQSLWLDGTENNVTLIHNVVSDKREELFPYTQDPHNQAWTVFLKKEEINGRKVDEPLMSVTLDQILDIIPVETIILKLDVEGSECKVLTNYLHKEKKDKFIPFIIMEWSHLQRNLIESLCPDLNRLIQGFVFSGYSPKIVQFNSSSLLPIKLSDLRRGEGRIPAENVLWVHKDTDNV